MWRSSAHLKRYRSISNSLSYHMIGTWPIETELTYIKHESAIMLSLFQIVKELSLHLILIQGRDVVTRQSKCLDLSSWDEVGMGVGDFGRVETLGKNRPI